MAETIQYLVGDGVLVWFLYHLSYWLRGKKAPPLRQAPGRFLARLVGLNVPALRARWRQPIVAAGLDPLLASVVAAGYYLRAGMPPRRTQRLAVDGPRHRGRDLERRGVAHPGCRRARHRRGRPALAARAPPPADRQGPPGRGRGYRGHPSRLST